MAPRAARLRFSIEPNVWKGGTDARTSGQESDCDRRRRPVSDERSWSGCAQEGVSVTFTGMSDGGYLVVAKDPACADRGDSPDQRARSLGRSPRQCRGTYPVRQQQPARDGRTGLQRPGTLAGVGADGSGATLAKRQPASATSDATNWTTSLQWGGTPGQPNFPASTIERVSAALISASTPRSSMCRPVIRSPMPGLSPPTCSEVGAKPGPPRPRAWALRRPRR